MEEAENEKPFPAIAGKVHTVVWGKQIVQCYALDMQWGRAGMGAWSGEADVLHSVCLLGWQGTDGSAWCTRKAIPKSLILRNLQLCTQAPRGPASCTCYGFVSQQVSGFSTATGTST